MAHKSEQMEYSNGTNKSTYIWSTPYRIFTISILWYYASGKSLHLLHIPNPRLHIVLQLTFTNWQNAPISQNNIETILTQRQSHRYNKEKIEQTLSSSVCFMAICFLPAFTKMFIMNTQTTLRLFMMNTNSLMKLDNLFCNR